MFARTWLIVGLLVCLAVIPGCRRAPAERESSSAPAATGANPTGLASSIPPTTTAQPAPVSVQPSPATSQPAPTNPFSKYAFPASIDPGSQYLFYIHGRIIEEQGIPAISPDFGEYEIGAILEELSKQGYVVISEQRPKNADSMVYARKIATQVRELLNAGVPAKNITIVGASKGGYIAIMTSNILKNNELNFVIMAICNPETVKDLEFQQVFLYGNVLSIYDSVDEFGGSCEGLLPTPRGQGTGKYEEIVLEIGIGHGILYKPMQEWIIPVVEWAK
jgi:hypothetical protein